MTAEPSAATIGELAGAIKSLRRFSIRTAPMAPILVADHLTKWYGPRLAVDDVSFEVGKAK